MNVDGFLAAMVSAIALALLAPSFGAKGGPIPFGIVTEIGIAFVFFLHGANLSRKALSEGATKWRLHLFVQTTTFVIFPIFGALIFYFGRDLMPTDLRLGVFFLCAICSTVSSSVAMVAIARGNVAAAVFDASLSSLIGMIATPALVGLVQTVSGSSLPFLRSVADIALQLFLPFLAGHLLHPLLADSVTRHKRWINRMDRSVIVLIVYTAFCQSTKDGVWLKFDVVTLAGVALLMGGLLVTVLALTSILSNLFGFSVEDRITAIFCGSKKSLASGAPISKVLFASSPALGAILLPLIIYHQVQLVICSIVAKRYAQRVDLPDHVASARAETISRKEATP